MTSRREFLDTVAARLGHGIPENPVRPILDVPNDPIEYAVDLSDPVATFVASTRAVGAEVVETTSAALPAVVLDVAREIGDGLTVALSDEAACHPIGEHLNAFGISIETDLSYRSLSDVGLGVTGVRAGIALTGSVVIDSSVPGARTISLLPDVHLAVVRREQVVEDAGAFLRRLDRSALPSNLVFITGPSRSADIELQLTIGVHGPGRLVIALVD